ncbi:MAG: hypothetical protein Q4E35_04790 [Eubacteriales bacterium]|nr:hypothetical protein [Eubacteriales bacterium]
MTDLRRTAFEVLPEHIRAYCEKSPVEYPEEIRLRTGSSVKLVSGGAERDTHSPAVTAEDLSRILEIATCASLHSAADSLKNGFITYKGIRIGTCGEAVTRNGEIYAFSRYTSLNIRIPNPFIGDLRKEAEEICALRANTLIVSPPGGGKTTALRELIRLISDEGYRVSVVDDRGEIFPGSEQGSTFAQGRCTDVISGADKESACLIMLRTMSPRFIALDEISRRQEMNAVREICGCGVNIISTAHGANAEEMRKRKGYGELFDEGIFTYVLEIGADGEKRTYRLRKIC